MRKFAELVMQNIVAYSPPNIIGMKVNHPYEKNVVLCLFLLKTISFLIASTDLQNTVKQSCVRRPWDHSKVVISDRRSSDKTPL